MNEETVHKEKEYIFLRKEKLSNLILVDIIASRNSKAKACRIGHEKPQLQRSSLTIVVCSGLGIVYVKLQSFSGTYFFCGINIINTINIEKIRGALLISKSLGYFMPLFSK